MAINIGYKQFPKCDICNDAETVYAAINSFRGSIFGRMQKLFTLASLKYPEQFKNNHLKGATMIAVLRFDSRSYS